MEKKKHKIHETPKKIVSLSRLLFLREVSIAQ